MIFGIRKWPVIPTVLVLVAMAIMVRLGFWQLDRMGEKDELIIRYSANQSDASIRAFQLGNADEQLFQTVELTCANPFDWQAVAGRDATGRTGYVQRYQCLINSVPGSPVAAANPTALYVVIGWSQSPVQVDWTGGVVTGVLAPLGDGFKLIADPPQAGLDASAKPDPADMPNNHLAYAGQWFFFAATALVIYVLAIRRRQRDQADTPSTKPSAKRSSASMAP